MRQPPELLDRVYRFSLASLRFFQKITQESRRTGAREFSSIKLRRRAWANYRAAQRGRSRAEFIAKLGTVAEECDEAVGWLEFMRDGEIACDAALLARGKGAVRNLYRVPDDRTRATLSADRKSIGARLTSYSTSVYFLLSTLYFSLSTFLLFTFYFTSPDMPPPIDPHGLAGNEVAAQQREHGI